MGIQKDTKQKGITIITALFSLLLFFFPSMVFGATETMHQETENNLDQSLLNANCGGAQCVKIRFKATADNISAVYIKNHYDSQNRYCTPHLGTSYTDYNSLASGSQTAVFGTSLVKLDIVKTGLTINTNYYLSIVCPYSSPNFGLSAGAKNSDDFVAVNPSNGNLQAYVYTGLIEYAGTVCGNGITESGETCDTSTTTCEILGYNGYKECNETCDGWETCATSETCGDNIINGNELCDGYQACTIGGYAGAKPCQDLCSFLGDCATSETCGDNIINGVETCDDGDDNGKIIKGCNSTCSGVQAPTPDLALTNTADGFIDALSSIINFIFLKIVPIILVFFFAKWFIKNAGSIFQFFKDKKDAFTFSRKIKKDHQKNKRRLINKK